ncbi:MAG: amidohydrolase family protein [Proteobacteria bacterium]|nr:amidohydrolase family protein [Pseudomonadota bacterium]
MRTLDMHTHFFPREWEDLGKRFGTPDWPSMRHLGEGKAMVMLGAREFRPVYEACWSAPRRLEEMDRDGVDLQVMCATPVLFAYARPVEQALYCAQLFNEAALELAAQGRGRLKTLCQVPLQDTDAACREVTRAMKSGHLGVQIGNHVGDRDLDDEGVLTFLQHCAQEGAAVLVHPWDMLGGARTARWMMAWTVSMPAETQLSIVAMILGGSFDRLPRTLRLCFAHGGGSFAFLLGRLENAWKNRDVARGVSEHPPSHYVDRFSVDSAVFDARALRLLIEVMGGERVMLGSDYPFPLGELRVGSLLRDMAGLDAGQRSRLLAGNALAFLGLDAEGNRTGAST